MGFGLLFIGYFVASLMTLNPVGALFRLIGYGMILISVLKLRKYHRAFEWSIIATILMILVSGVMLFADTMELLHGAMLTSATPISAIGRNVIGYVEQGCSLIFLAFLLYAIRKIALETEVQKIVVSSVRNFVFVCLYYFICVIGYLPFESVRNCSAELRIISLLLYFAVILLNLLLIWKCYANICDESDVEMNRKPSRFAWINRFREEFDRREEKARRETAAYRQEKMEKRKNKRKKK